MTQPPFLANAPTNGNLHCESGRSAITPDSAVASARRVHFDLSRIRIEPKLAISRPGDEHEREAERVAAAVMSGSAMAKSRIFDSSGDEHEVGRRLSDESQHSTMPPPAVISALSSSSQPLEPEARKFMEVRFGYDFSRVRIHENSEASQASRAIAARAYTVGSDIVFGAGQYRPNSHGGRQLIAHELTHVLQQRNHRPMLCRSILYPDAAVTRNDDPILRYLRNDDSIALTTLTINGVARLTDRVLQDAFNPKGIEPKGQPVAPPPTAGSRGPGSGAGSGGGTRTEEGSGSGSGGGGSAAGGGATAQCGFKNFDVKISANIRLPPPPADGRWGPDEVERKDITRPGLPGKCGGRDRTSVVMKAEPNSADFYQWLEDNEQQHATDIKVAADQFLVPDHQAVLAMRGTGADANACAADLNNQLSRLSTDNVQRFLRKVKDDVALRDVPGGHKFDARFEERNDCNNLSIVLKKTPAPAQRGR
jgi:uncharacterized membrane protein YgcG